MVFRGDDTQKTEKLETWTKHDLGALFCTINGSMAGIGIRAGFSVLFFVFGSYIMKWPIAEYNLVSALERKALLRVLRFYPVLLNFQGFP